jgi:hypothetical protein
VTKFLRVTNPGYDLYQKRIGDYVYAVSPTYGVGVYTTAHRAVVYQAIQAYRARSFAQGALTFQLFAAS